MKTAFTIYPVSAPGPASFYHRDIRAAIPMRKTRLSLTVSRSTTGSLRSPLQVEEERRRITRGLRLGDGAGTDTVMSHLQRL